MRRSGSSSLPILRPHGWYRVSERRKARGSVSVLAGRRPGNVHVSLFVQYQRVRLRKMMHDGTANARMSQGERLEGRHVPLSLQAVQDVCNGP